MTRYSVQPGDKKNLKDYEFLSFAKNMVKNIGKNMSKNIRRNSSKSLNIKCSQKLLDHVKQSAKDDKIADKTRRVSKIRK